MGFARQVGFGGFFQLRDQILDGLGAFFVAHHGHKLFIDPHGPVAGVLVLFYSDHRSSFCPG